MITKAEIDAHDAEMERKKKSWPIGPWTNEPNRINWKWEGLDCMIIRNDMGALCGYVGVPKGHKYFGKNYGDVPGCVHGGLTYSSICKGKICHIAEDDDETWWFGFDCGHAGDLIPAMEYLHDSIPALQSIRDKFKGVREDTYKDIHFVRVETETLARQLQGVH